MKKSRSSEARTVGRLTGAAIKVTAFVNSGMILETLSDSYLKRDKLPEPFDLPDHIGNFREGSIVTAAACGIIGIFTCLNSRLEGTAEQFKKRARLTAAAAFVTSAVVQVVGEKYGLSNVVGGGNAPDMLDAAYGTAWSGVTAGVAYRYAVKTDAELRVAHDARMAELKENLHADEPALSMPPLAEPTQPQ